MRRSVGKAVLLVLFITLGAGLIWFGLLYKTYGRQTLLFLLRSSPELIWSYSKAAMTNSDTDESGSRGLFNTSVLERPEASLPPIASKHAISGMSHTYQKLNNCGPSSASMAASVLGKSFDQFFAAEVLKGGPSDKNVGPQEMVRFLESQGLKVAYRLNGNAAMIEQLVSRDIPVIVEQWLVKRGSGELVGHYRVVKGYDQTSRIFTTNDSFDGPNLVIPYSQFDEWWRPFNRTYLVVYKPEQEEAVKLVLQTNWDETLNFQGAAAIAAAETKSIGDGYSYFNLGTANTLLHKYSEAQSAYDQAFTKTLPEHFLWYEFGPLEAYYQTGQYEQVLKITDEVLRQAGPTEESLYYRSLVFTKQGKTVEAEEAREKAYSANPRFVPPFE